MASSFQMEIQELRERLDRLESLPVQGTEEWRKRQAEGIRKAQERGQHFGRERLEMPEGFENLADKWIRKEITAEAASKALGVSSRTFRRRARERCYGYKTLE